MGLRSRRLVSWAMNRKAMNICVKRRCRPVFARFTWSRKLIPLVLLALLMAAIPVASRTKDKLPYGEPLIVNIPMPAGEVEQVVEKWPRTASSGEPRNTTRTSSWEARKPPILRGYFHPGIKAGKFSTKSGSRRSIPRNFKDTSDVGTLAVRYVVQAQGEKNTVLRIEALFKEDFRHIVHQSNGSVESAEYKDIREHLDEIETMKSQNVESEKEREEQLAKKRSLEAQNNPPPSPANPWPGQPKQVAQSSSVRAAQTSSVQVAESSSIQAAQPVAPASSEPAPAGQTPPGQTLEERVKSLRGQVERLVKSPGAPLKSAPFHTASTLQLLGTGTEVLIVISTPYWYGVETHEGQHGWVQRDQLELLP